MAEGNSTETGSRRNTPQLATESAKTARATRSQSREVSEVGVPRYSERVQRKPKPAAAGMVDRGNSQMSTRSRRKGVPEQTDLPTVNERPSMVIDDETGKDQAIEDDQQHLPTLDSKSTGRVSGISGTTARTSNATQELTGVAPGDLIVLDALPDLLESATRFLSGLLSEEISDNAISRMRSGLRDKRSSFHRSRKRFMVDLDSCFPDDSSNTFLDISNALPILYQSWDDKDAEGEPIAPIFDAANLAILALNILLYPHQKDAIFLKNLDATFVTGYAKDQHGRYLAIITRIQYAIEQLSEYAGRPNFDHDLVLKQVFYNKDGRTLRGYNTLKKQDKKYKDALTKTHDVIVRMRAIWTDEGQSSPVERLKEFYSWDKYVSDMMIWIGGENEEVEAILSTIEIEDVISGMKDSLRKITRAQQASGGDGDHAEEVDTGQIDLSSYSPPSKPSGPPRQQDEQLEQSSIRAKELADSDYLHLGSPRLALGVKSMKRLMAQHTKAFGSGRQASRNQLRSASSGNQVAAAEAVTEAQDSTPQSERVPLAPYSAPAKIHEDHEPIGEDSDSYLGQHADDDNLDAGSQPDDEEAAFQTQQIDRKNAERALQLKESREAESNKENQAESSQRPNKKRLIDPQANAQKETWDSQDMSQDEGFQGSHRRPNSDRQILQPVTKRNLPEPPATAGPSPAKRARVQSPPIGDEDDPPQPSQVYKYANQAAKQMTALQPKPAQIRRPWTEEETGRLLELIETFGISWKLLKLEDERDGLILENRNQVALKDKARNMKFDFLKAGRILPKHFDQIPLSRPLIDKLRGLNIVYDPLTKMREDAEEVVFE